MKKHTYSIWYDGQNFTRTTARTYTHVVLRHVSYADEIADAERLATSDWDGNEEWYALQAQGTAPPDFLSRWPDYIVSESAQAYAKERIALGRAGYIAEAKARAAANHLPGTDHYWFALGWAGRLDLAVKLAKPGDEIIEIPERK